MAKINRNAPCPCGSSKKYKKCCLSNKVDQAQEKKANMLAFMGKFKNRFKDKKMTGAYSEDMGATKMSEVILDFADELLSLAHTEETQEKAMMIAIYAWNLALIDKSEHESMIEGFMKLMHIEKCSQNWHDVSQILAVFIDKKETEYPSINRYILDFKFTDTKSGGHLNVISSETPNN